MKSASSSVAGAAEQPRHLVHQLLQVVAHRRPPPALSAAFVHVYESTGGGSDICPWPEGAGLPSVGVSTVHAPGGPVLLQKALLAASRRPGLRRFVTGNPATRRVVDRFVAGETLDDALAAVRALARRRHRRHPRPPRRGHHRPRRGRAHAATPTWRCSRGWRRSGSGRRAEVSVKLSAFGQALPRRARPRARAGAPGRRGGDRDGHDGHPRHGGPPHRRLHARRRSPSCARSTRHRRGAAGDALPHRGRRQGAGRHRFAGPAGQGRLQRAGRPSRTRRRRTSTPPTPGASRS